MTKKGKIGVIICAALIGLTLGFIWINSCLSGESSAAGSGRIYNLIKVPMDFLLGEGVYTHHHFRKTIHFCEFFALALEVCFLYLFLGNFKIYKYLHICAYGLFVAVVDESIQILSSRGSSVKDVLLDYLGYICASVIFFAAHQITVRVKKRKK